jgi:hypothetical protein
VSAIHSGVALARLGVRVRINIEVTADPVSAAPSSVPCFHYLDSIGADLKRPATVIREADMWDLQALNANSPYTSWARWLPSEDRVVRELHPDYSSMLVRLPYRSRGALTRRAYTLGLVIPTRALWSEEEDARLRADPTLRVLPGRTRGAINKERRKLGQSRPRLYTSEEVAALKAGARTLPGRTERSIAGIRRRLGLTRPNARWGGDEVTILRTHLGTRSYAQLVREFLPGRTRNGAQRKALGFGGNVVQHISDPGGLIEAIEREVPHGLPPLVRQEVLQELALWVLEGAINMGGIQQAVQKAIRQTYAMYPVLGAPLSLDAPGWDGGPPLIERVTESVWA